MQGEDHFQNHWHFANVQPWLDFLFFLIIGIYVKQAEKKMLKCEWILTWEKTAAKSIDFTFNRNVFNKVQKFY